MEHRPPEYQTTIIVRKFTDLLAYAYHDRIQSTISSMIDEIKRGGKIFYNSGCPEFITAKYEVIIYSKFDFLKEDSLRKIHITLNISYGSMQEHSMMSLLLIIHYHGLILIKLKHWVINFW